MTRRTKKISIAAMLTLLLGVSVTTPFIINSNKSKKLQNQTFKDNTYSYAEKFKNFKKTELSEKSFSELKEYEKLSTDPNNSVYNSIFKKIDKNVIQNDLYNMLSRFSDKTSNFGFLVNISSVEVFKNDNKWNIEISFSIYNTNDTDSNYSLNNSNALIQKKKIINSKILINSELQKEFYINNKDNNKSDLYVNYYFNNAKWYVGNYKILTLPNFYLGAYSKTLNTVIKDVDTSLSYLDIKNEATNSIKKLSISNIKDDISNTYNSYFDLATNLADPIQNILQNMIISHNSNEKGIDYLKNNARDIGIIVNTLVNNILKIDKNILPIIQAILEDRKIFEILSNEDIKNSFLNISSLLPHEIGSVIENILGNISTEEQFYADLEKLIDKSNQMLTNEQIENIKDFIQITKQKGFLTSILLKKDTFLSLINSFIPENPILNVITPFIKNVSILDSTIIEFIIDALSKKDSNDKVYFRELLSVMLNNPGTSSIFDLLDKFIFNNNNLTASNLITAIDVIANPKTSKNGQIIARYKEWLQSIKQESKFANEQKLDSDLNIKLTYIHNYTFTSDIYFNISKLIEILPNNLEVNGSWIPISTIKLVTPNWMGIIKNDGINVKLELNDKIEYDVVKSNFKNKLSWQAYSNITVDMNMPATVKSLWDESSWLVSDIIINLTKSLFYHVYNANQYFRPYSSSVENINLDKFNYNSKTNEAIYKKEMTQERIKEIINDYNSKTQNITYIDDNGKSQSYVIKKGSYWSSEIRIYKTITKSTFDFESIIDEFVDTSKYQGKFILSINNNRLISEFNVKIFGIEVATVPNVNLSSVTILTPYNVYSDNETYLNSFSFKLQ